MSINCSTVVLASLLNYRPTSAFILLLRMSRIGICFLVDWPCIISLGFAKTVLWSERPKGGNVAGTE